VPASSCSSLYKTCFNTQLDIQDDTGVVQFPGRSLTVELVRSSLTLKGNPSIDNAILQYSPSVNSPQWVDVLSCDDAPASDVNCYVPVVDALGVKHKGKVDSFGNWIFTWKVGQNGLRAY
jgi:hypothetical protein